MRQRRAVVALGRAAKLGKLAGPKSLFCSRDALPSGGQAGSTLIGIPKARFVQDLQEPKVFTPTCYHPTGQEFRKRRTPKKHRIDLVLVFQYC